MKKLLIYFSVCISIFSADIEEKNIEEQRTKDLIYEKVKLDYEYSQRKNKADYLIFKYLTDYELDYFQEENNYDTRVFEFLISKGANINSTNPDFFYELLESIYNPKLYEYLIEKGLKVDREIKEGYSLLMPFIINHYPEEYIISLINKDVKVTEDSRMVGKEMIWAASRDYSEELIDKLYSITKDKEALVLNLVCGICNPSSEGEMLLIKKVLRYFLKKGISFNNAELIETLLEKEVSDIEVYEVLFEGGLEPNLKNNNNTPILITAVYKENYGVVELLLRKGANPNVVGFDGETVLNYTEDSEIYNLLVKYGAKE